MINNKTPITILDLEHLSQSHQNSITLIENGNLISEDFKMIFNPNKEDVIKLINGIFENNGRCPASNSSSNHMCPCINMVKYGKCECGLFVRR